MNDNQKKTGTASIIIIALIVVFLTTAPFLYGHLTRPAGSVFTGLHHLAPGDTNVFLSMIEQVQQGENIFINLYTAEPQQRIFINPLWLSVGWLGKLFHLPNLVALHLARSLLIIAFVFVLYAFLGRFFSNERHRRWALIVIVFSSGLGVFFNPFLFDVNNLIEHPTDIWVSESITFLTLLHSPHLIASLTLIIVIFMLMLRAFETNRWRYSVWAGLAFLLLLWFHPFNGPTIVGVLGVYVLVLWLRQRRIHWPHVKHVAILGAIGAPAVLYLWLIAQADPVIREWSAQNILPSPSVWMWLIGYGLLVPLAIYGVVKIWHSVSDAWLFILCWAGVSAILLYVPVSFQRRLSEGLHIPIALLAFMGIVFLLRRLGASRYADQKKFAVIFALALFLPLTNVQIIGQDFFLFTVKKDLPYYLTGAEVEAMHWLRDHAAPDEVTFSSYYTGNYLPAYSGRIVWIGHGPQTINLPQKFELNEWFWANDEDAGKKEILLHGDGVDYVWYGRKEKELGSFNPSAHAYLESVFSNTDVTIYRVAAE